MSKNSKPKSVTILGGKNVAPGAAPPEKPPKAETAESETPETDTPGAPEKPTE